MSRSAPLLVLILLLAPACGSQSSHMAALAGRYTLDARVLMEERIAKERLAVRARLESATAAEREVVLSGVLNLARQEAKITDLRLDLRPDGRFQALYHYGAEEGGSAGTWSLSDGALILVTRYEGGRRLTDPYSLRLVPEAQGLRVNEQVGVPIPFTLRKVPSTP